MQLNASRILVLDDDPGILTSLELLLKRHFQEVHTENDPRKLTHYLNSKQADVFLLDMNFRKGQDDGKEGLYWLEYIKEVQPQAAVILMTAYGEIELAVEAIKAGAMDFVLKPWNNEKLLATVRAGAELSGSKKKLKSLEQNNEVLQKELERPFSNFIGSSSAMQEVFKTIEKVGATDANVLILGENGTGKELVARALHKASQRRSESFIHVDLGSLSESLFESELFGHKKGAFTDAKEDRVGRFELAQGGTLFLDEIGNLPEHLQSKLLTVLQNRRIERLGSEKSIDLDIRLISATNQDIIGMIGEGKFRQDLLYRINTVEIKLPALRERKEDIALLADYYLKEYSKKYHKGNPKIDVAAIEAMKNYSWPGNVRELQHAMERAVILCESGSISTMDLRLEESASTLPGVPKSLNLDEHEKHLIDKALKESKGNISHAAKALGLTRAALYRRLEKHGLL